MKTWRLTLSVLVALLAGFAFVTQLAIVVKRNVHDATALLGGLNNFFSFFTVLTNILVLVVVAGPMIRPDTTWGKRLARFRVRSAVLTYISIVGIVNALLLRHLVHLEGLEAVLERIFHDAVPILYFVYWLFLSDRTPIRWKDLMWWAVYPAVYLIYILIRGKFIERYPYPFMNVEDLGLEAVLVNAAFMAGAIFGLGVLVMVLNTFLVHFLTRNGSFGPERA